jgi:hypothetical protein
VLDGEAPGAEGKEPGEVGRAVTVGAEGRVHKALVQHQACDTTRACQLYPLMAFCQITLRVHSPLTYTMNPELKFLVVPIFRLHTTRPHRVVKG